MGYGIVVCGFGDGAGQSGSWRAARGDQAYNSRLCVENPAGCFHTPELIVYRSECHAIG